MQEFVVNPIYYTKYSLHFVRNNMIFKLNNLTKLITYNFYPKYLKENINKLQLLLDSTKKLVVNLMFKSKRSDQEKLKIEYFSDEIHLYMPDVIIRTRKIFIRNLLTNLTLIYDTIKNKKQIKYKIIQIDSADSIIIPISGLIAALPRDIINLLSEYLVNRQITLNFQDNEDKLFIRDASSLITLNKLNKRITHYYGTLFELNDTRYCIHESNEFIHVNKNLFLLNPTAIKIIQSSGINIFNTQNLPIYT